MYKYISENIVQSKGKRWDPIELYNLRVNKEGHQLYHINAAGLVAEKTCGLDLGGIPLPR